MFDGHHGDGWSSVDDENDDVIRTDDAKSRTDTGLIQTLRLQWIALMMRKLVGNNSEEARASPLPGSSNQSAQLLLEEEEREKQQEQLSRTRKQRERKKKQNKKRATQQSSTGNNNNNKSISNVCDVAERQSCSSHSSNSPSAKNPDASDAAANSDVEGFDLNSAFARANLSSTSSVLPTSASAGSNNNNNSSIVRAEAEQLTLKGIEMVGKGRLQEAERLFSGAIRRCPEDHRFYGNRSFCRERQQQFDKALADSDRAIELNADWPKGHFRRGRALLGLQRYDEAEAAFWRVLSLDADASECRREIVRINTYRLQQLGFSRRVSRAVAEKHDSYTDALETIASPSFSPLTVVWDPDVSDSDDETGAPDLTGNHVDPKQDPSNQENITSLWVGNVASTVSEEEFEELFSKFGEVISIRLLLDRRCAFVNFRNPSSTSRCMSVVQGMLYHGHQLKLKYPDRMFSQQQQPSQSLQNSVSTDSESKQNKTWVDTGSLQRECFFWRTSNCVYGSNCRYRHVPEHKQIDRRVSRP